MTKIVKIKMVMTFIGLIIAVLIVFWNIKEYRNFEKSLTSKEYMIKKEPIDWETIYKLNAIWLKANEVCIDKNDEKACHAREIIDRQIARIRGEKL